MSVTSSALYLLYYFSGAAGGVVPDEVSVPDDDQEPLRRHVSVLVLVTPGVLMVRAVVQGRAGGGRGGAECELRQHPPAARGSCGGRGAAGR